LQQPQEAPDPAGGRAAAVAGNQCTEGRLVHAGEIPESGDCDQRERVSGMTRLSREPNGWQTTGETATMRRR
jgi:hypothetical protein